MASVTSFCLTARFTIFLLRGSLLHVRRASLCPVAALAVLTTSGCVDGFRGSNVQIDLSNSTPVQAHVGSAPTGAELPANSHFTLYGVQQGDAGDQLFEVQRFEIHRMVDPTSPCFIDAGEHVMYPGLHVTQYAARVEQDLGVTDPTNPPPTVSEQDKVVLATALQRMTNVQLLASDAGIRAVVSASTAVYPAVATDCNGGAGQLPPATCIDDASNARRLALCQQTWAANPEMWEGSDRVLTVPLNATTYGLVDGRNPISNAPVGGAQFFVENALENIDAYAIYAQQDGMPDPGTQIYFGKPFQTTRGVMKVHLVNPQDQALTAEMAIFADLGTDDVHF